MAKLMSVLVVLVALVVGMCGYYQQSPTVVFYRWSTTFSALYKLFNLPEQDVKDFVGSYQLFEKENYEGKEDEKLIVNYYKVINQLCALGDVEKMYIPPVMDQKKGIFANQLIWEEKGMGDKLGVGKGQKILDVGCGRGRIAHHMATYTGAKVVGLNLDPSQLANAREYANETGMGDQLEFVQGNYNDPLPFADQSFDALYHVQALTYAQDLVALLKEMNRVLKPGAKISFLDWFKLPAYNPEDKHHQFLLGEVKAVIGAVHTPSPEEYHAALKEAGFEVIFSGEASADGGHQYPLVMQAEFFYETLKSVVNFMAEWKMIPYHFKTLLDRLTFGGQSFVEADKLGLFTTSWQIIAKKI
mmetsp:Transcript_72638/g.151623  ORF Transcript_72638/g.151623 Transcript_72638/m.151623 type:complete len:358 (-) Transcript_72638:213-1286(-)|eukprot:CAMPEP_0206448396 /NCGR_PEP_ID=MMETSP0324_2-20121206/17442_1 /ASSEMBLY_ACC=CAM_ASM_000836 /TAXON_ID=2866 /ORGANISM="Crypthecodinium cohnii, Strain Seligo" /LENGTH=357 /DNA_ID=CAMNT_0053917521 /DNA_START=116 /DNA_END=1189 /DNA_ORIENTATION=+